MKEKKLIINKVEITLFFIASFSFFIYSTWLYIDKGLFEKVETPSITDYAFLIIIILPYYSVLIVLFSIVFSIIQAIFKSKNERKFRIIYINIAILGFAAPFLLTTYKFSDDIYFFSKTIIHKNDSISEVFFTIYSFFLLIFYFVILKNEYNQLIGKNHNIINELHEN
jgi:hypothetical protein